MGNLREFSNHVRWNSQEITVIKNHYEHSSYDELLKLLPNRSIGQIQNKAHSLEIARYKKPKQTKEERLESKRLFMQNLRKRNPEQVRQYQKQRRNKNIEKHRKTASAYTARRFFWTKSMKLKGDAKATYLELAKQWKKQRGLCALTNRKLDATAHLDHIIPRAKGGSDSIDNLRWLCMDANLSKRDLMDDDFIKLCKEIIKKAEDGLL